MSLIWQFGVSVVFQPCFRSCLPLFIGNGQAGGGGQHFGGPCQLGLLLPPFGVWRRILRRSGHSPRGYLLPCCERGARCRFLYDGSAFQGNPQEVFPETQLIEKPGFSVLLNTP